MTSYQSLEEADESVVHISLWIYCGQFTSCQSPDLSVLRRSRSTCCECRINI